MRATDSHSTLLRPDTSRRDRFLLLGSALAYCLIYFLFYPLIVTTMDESAMVNMAYAYRQGVWYADLAGLDIVFGHRGAGGHIMPQYPPGMSAILAGFSFLGWNSLFLMGLVFHLATYGVLILILRRLNLSPLLAIFYLFYPTCVIYSRTVMSDLPSGTMTALLFLFLLRGQPLIAGTMLGLSGLIRTPNFIALPIVMLGVFLDALWEQRNSKGFVAGIRDAVLVLVGALPFFAFAYWYQSAIQGGMWGKYGGMNVSVTNLPKTLPTYLISMNVILPGMLLTPLLYWRAARFSLMGLTYGFVLFYSLSFFTDATGSATESLIIGQRYIQVVIPVFCVAYAAACQKFILDRFPKWGMNVFLVAFALLLVLAGAIHYRHQNYLKGLAEMRQAVLRSVAPTDKLFCNVHVAKLLHPTLARRRFTLLGSGEGGIENEAQLTRRQLEEALNNGSGQRIVVASWTRDYRAESGAEKEHIARIEQNFVVEKPGTTEGKTLPPGFVVLYVLGKKP